MKTNIKLKLAMVISTFVALTFLASKPVSAGLYGSSTVLPSANEEIHETVDAGVEDLIPQMATTFVALSGLISTSVLIKKIK